MAKKKPTITEDDAPGYPPVHRPTGTKTWYGIWCPHYGIWRCIEPSQRAARKRNRWKGDKVVAIHIIPKRQQP